MSRDSGPDPLDDLPGMTGKARTVILVLPLVAALAALALMTGFIPNGCPVPSDAEEASGATGATRSSVLAPSNAFQGLSGAAVSTSSSSPSS